jgi:hypothetical protein
MPDLSDVLDDSTMDAEDVQQVIASWKGYSGKGVPLEQTSVNDTTKYAGRFKNLDTTNGRALRADNASGSALLDVTKDGVTFSPDGVSFGATPDALGLAQTITATKTFAAPQNWKYITSVASQAGAQTLPSSGNIFQITGTNTITSIVATGFSGARLILYFSGALQMTDGSNLDLDGNFYSQAGSRLALWCDGTDWHEEYRVKPLIPICSLYRASSQSVADNADDAIIWDTESSDARGFHAASATAIIPTVAGIYLVVAAVNFAFDKDGQRRLYLKRDSAQVSPGITANLGHNTTSGTPLRLQVADVITFDGVAQALEVRAAVEDAGSAVNVQGGAAETFVYMRWLGPE